MVTESDDLREALDDAAARWPGLSRSQLVVRLALAGHVAAQDRHEERGSRRSTALRRHAGALRGVYPPDYLERLRDDCPA